MNEDHGLMGLHSSEPAQGVSPEEEQEQKSMLGWFSELSDVFQEK